MDFPAESDNLAWWRSDDAKRLFPNLRLLAQKWLGRPPTQAADERSHSKSGLILTSRRNRLCSEKVEKLHVISSCVATFGGVHTNQDKPFQPNILLQVGPAESKVAAPSINAEKESTDLVDDDDDDPSFLDLVMDLDLERALGKEMVDEEPDLTNFQDDKPTSPEPHPEGKEEEKQAGKSP
jgi:hypothetical protein